MEIDEINWIEEIRGKTLRAIRTGHDEGTSVPHVIIIFKDGSRYRIDVKDGVYFEAAMFNGLRKAQPVSLIDKRVEIYSGLTVIDVRAETFPLFTLRVIDRKHLHFQPVTMTKIGVTRDDR